MLVYCEYLWCQYAHKPNFNIFLTVCDCALCGYGSVYDSSKLISHNYYEYIVYSTVSFSTG